MSSGADEVQAAVNASVLDVSVSHGSQLLAEVRAVLVLDVLDDRVPATNTFNDPPSAVRPARYVPSLVVDLVGESRGIDDV